MSFSKTVPSSIMHSALATGVIVAIAVGATAFSGCILPAPIVGHRDAFILEFQLNDHGHEEKYADPGRHCGDASRSGTTLTIGLWPDEEIPEGPWLAVFPRLPSGWHAGLGAESYKTTLPRTIEAGLYDDPTPIGEITWEPQEEGGVMRVDGRAVSLPHSWRVNGEGGTWSADATLSAWDGEVDHERYGGYCD